MTSVWDKGSGSWSAIAGTATGNIIVAILFSKPCTSLLCLETRDTFATQTEVISGCSYGCSCVARTSLQELHLKTTTTEPFAWIWEPPSSFEALHLKLVWFSLPHSFLPQKFLFFVQPRAKTYSFSEKNYYFVANPKIKIISINPQNALLVSILPTPPPGKRKLRFRHRCDKILWIRPVSNEEPHLRPVWHPRWKCHK